MRKLIVFITLLYALAIGILAGYLSDWFRLPVPATSSVLLPFLIGIPFVLVIAAVAYWHENEWLVLVLILIVGGSLAYVAKVHHDRFGSWLPAAAPEDVESSGVATLTAHGKTLRYRLELYNAGLANHREALIVTQDGRDRTYLLPLFDDKHSGHVSAKSPSDWIVLRATSDPDIVDAEAGRFLLVQRTFRINLATGEIDSKGRKQ
jgi:hypothetical protein